MINDIFCELPAVLLTAVDRPASLSLSHTTTKLFLTQRVSTLFSRWYIGCTAPEAKQSCHSDTCILVFFCCIFHTLLNSHHHTFYCISIVEKWSHSTLVLVWLVWLSQSRWLLQDSAPPHTTEVHATRCEMPHSNLTTYQNWLTPSHLQEVYLTVVYDIISCFVIIICKISFESFFFFFLSHVGPTYFNKSWKKNMELHVTYCIVCFHFKCTSACLSVHMII